MPGPWEAFQDSAAGDLSRNDQNITAPARAPVQSSPRVWGDDEAKRAGLYESPAGPWSAFQKQPAPTPQIPQRAPLRITVPLGERFGQMQPPETGAADLQRGLDQRGLELTRGPEASPAAQMAISHENALSAATQSTTPDVSQYGGKLISTQTFEDDGGNIHYLDPETKKLKPVNASTQVAIRDPADNTVKVFDRSDATNEGALAGVARVVTNANMAGAPTARAAIPAAGKIVPASGDIIATAKPFYRAFDAEAANTPIAADEAKNMVDRLQNALDAAHLPAEVAKQVHDTVALIGKNGETALTQLQYVKRAVGNLFKSPDENVRSGAGVATREIGQMISEISDTASANLKKADAIRQAGRAKQVLETNADIASLRTGRAGYGGNAVNNMRTFVEKIAETAAKGGKTPFKSDEIEAMRDIVNGNKLTNGLREVGSLAPSKGGIAIGTGILTGGLSTAIGAAANKLATVLTRNQLNRLEELVAKRSPAYAEAIARATKRFEEAQMQLGNQPSPNRLAALVSASRALSSGLNRDGVQITSGQLMKAISGPPKAAADGDAQQSPNVPGQ